MQVISFFEIFLEILDGESAVLFTSIVVVGALLIFHCSRYFFNDKNTSNKETKMFKIKTKV